MIIYRDLESMPTAEHSRLQEIRNDFSGWRHWGPYVSDRAWGTVREDYSANGEPWTFLTHDMARSKAYRWGEDGIAGICDRYQRLVFAPAFWNGKDTILKERLFGLTSFEGNHGEDVKECYFHVDNTPTHSYMAFLYKYPQAEFPYRLLVEENQRRHGQGPEFEILDTAIFDDNRYFDIFIEYAKHDPEDICIRIEAFNRGPAPATLHVLPQIWFRNTWSWSPRSGGKPLIEPGPTGPGFVGLIADDSQVTIPSQLPFPFQLGPRTLYGYASSTLLFTENETNLPLVFGPEFRNTTPFVKDAFHRWLVSRESCINPNRVGTKAAFHQVFPEIPAGGSVTVRLRLSNRNDLTAPLAEVDGVIAQRRDEADEFYGALAAKRANSEERHIQRRAFAGLLWNKMTYIYDVDVWLKGDSEDWPPHASRNTIRNQHWRHLNSMRVMTVPDKWEYPWFAAWDLAFQCVTLALVDSAYAKEQLWSLLFEQFLHPNGQIPAYEWEFSDLNPPVHAWAVWRVYTLDRQITGRPDRDFLERCFHKLLMNFSWWINKVDQAGNNIFEGGFLGLDNITVFDRSKPQVGEARLEQADSTGWMGMFCLNLMRIALELARDNRVYEGLATKFFQHYTYVAAAMKHMGGRDYQLWDEKDGFFYDVLRFPDGRFRKFRVRSLVGLIPLFAVERLESSWIEPLTDFKQHLEWFLRNRNQLVCHAVHSLERDGKKIHVMTIVDDVQLTRIVQRLWDPDEFLSPFGIRSLSKFHEAKPFEFEGNFVRYEPAEAETKIKGGNSNWRGPIWFPTCYLLLESFRKLGQAFGDSFEVTLKDGKRVTFQDMTRDLAERLIGIFRRDSNGRRPADGKVSKFNLDPHWRDHLLFHEYFHGDTGTGLGAAHQTGWTALVASIVNELHH